MSNWLVPICYVCGKGHIVAGDEYECDGKILTQHNEWYWSGKCRASKAWYEASAEEVTRVRITTLVDLPASVVPAGTARKDQPLYSGCLEYFPDALLAVSHLSKLGSDKHNPGQPLHWSKEKSADHADCIARHLLEHGKIDPDTGLSHSVAVAWRALALLQTEIEKERK